MTAMFKIEKGVPVAKAKPRNPAGRPPKYPFRSMKIGDSFFVPGGGIGTLCGCARSITNATRMQFVIRKVDGGVRVWRVA